MCQTRSATITSAVTIHPAATSVGTDTARLVQMKSEEHCDRTYPNLVRLFRETGIESQVSDMCFAVSCRRTGLEYSSRGGSG